MNAIGVFRQKCIADEMNSCTILPGDQPTFGIAGEKVINMYGDPCPFGYLRDFFVWLKLQRNMRAGLEFCGIPFVLVWVPCSWPGTRGC